MTQKIIHNTVFNESHPAFDLVDTSIVELKSHAQTRFVSAHDLFDYTPHIIWTKDSITTNAVGALLFHPMRRDYLRVLMACVSPACRRQGIFSAMWAELQFIVTRYETRGIFLCVNVGVPNDAMYGVLNSIGSVPRWLHISHNSDNESVDAILIPSERSAGRDKNNGSM